MDVTILPQHIIDVILNDVHPNLSSLLTHINNDDDDTSLLPISLILRSNLEEHFKNVLLSDSFKNRVLPIAASIGSISTLSWALSYPILWYDKIGIVLAAATNGEIEALKFMTDNNLLLDNFNVKEHIKIISSTIKAGKLECCIYLLEEHGFENYDYVLNVAGGFGQLEVLEWACNEQYIRYNRCGLFSDENKLNITDIKELKKGCTIKVAVTFTR